MRKNNFFKIISLVICFSLLLSVSIQVLALNEYNWYCVHRKDHKQPMMDSNLLFIEDHHGYYIDRNHGDDCDEKVIYLTFDAGYENGNIEKILDTLKAEDVDAAFFILGNLVDSEPELVKRMFEDGHLVCNHTFSHKKTTGKSKDEISSELCKLESLCKEKTGYDMAKYYRPPEGKFDQTSLMHIDSLGYKTVFWSFAYVDWENDKQPSLDAAKKKILENIHNGEIMLLHPTSETNALILGDIISELKAQGFRFGTLDELK